MLFLTPCPLFLASVLKASGVIFGAALLAFLLLPVRAAAQQLPLAPSTLQLDGATPQARGQASCTEEPLAPGIQFTYGGRVRENDPEGSTNVQATVEISGAAEFVPGTQATTKGTWTTFNKQNGVLDIGTTAGGEVIDFSFDVQSTGAGTATYTFSASDEGGVRGTFTCDFVFGEELPAGLSGIKWDDANGNGQFDDGEEGLSGWSIQLDTGQSTTTDGNGAYSFTDLEPGTYTVSEASQDGWTQTFPGGGGTHTISLEAGQFVEGVNFGNEPVDQEEGSLVVEKDFVRPWFFNFQPVKSHPIPTEAVIDLRLFVRIRITNTASEVAQNVIVEDEVPVGLAPKDPSDGCSINLTTVRCEVGDLGLQETAYVYFRTKPQELGNFVNTAMAVSDNVPGDDDSADITIYGPEEDIEGTAEPAEQTVSKGEQGTASFTVTNTSDEELFAPLDIYTGGGMVIIDATPSDGECGETDEGDTVCAAVVDGGDTFTTQVTFEGTEVGTSTISAGVGAYTVAVATVTVEEAAAPPDVAVTKTGFSTVPVGDTLAYEIRVSNVGERAAAGIEVQDILPESVELAPFESGDVSIIEGPKATGVSCEVVDGVLACTIARLDPTETEQEGVQIAVHVVPTQPGTIENVATVTADEDANPENNETPPVVTEVTPAEEPTADLSIVKQTDQQKASLEQPFTYTFTVTNHGPADALDVKFIDMLPLFMRLLDLPSSCTSEETTEARVYTCALGDLPAGESVDVSLRAIVEAEVTGQDTLTIGDDLTNRSHTQARRPPDPNPDNDSSDVAVAYVGDMRSPEADLTLKKVLSDENPVGRVGVPFTYEITVRNDGPADATGVTVVDVLPSSLRYVASRGPSPTPPCSPTNPNNNRELLCAIGALAASEQVTVFIEVKPLRATTVTNTAEIFSADQSDPDSTPNNANPEEDDHDTVDATVESSVTVLTDPDTRFHRFWVIGHDSNGISNPFERENRMDDKAELEGDLGRAGNQADGSTSTTLVEPTEQELEMRLDSLQEIAEPGDEVTFIYQGHGWNGVFEDGDLYDPDNNQDESSTGDETIRINENTDLTDDKLAEMLLGFDPGVTVVVLMTSCYGGGFADSPRDIQESDNVTVIGASGTCPQDGGSPFDVLGGIPGAFVETLPEAIADGAGEGEADLDGDGSVTADELETWLEDQG